MAMTEHPYTVTAIVDANAKQSQQAAAIECIVSLSVSIMLETGRHRCTLVVNIGDVRMRPRRATSSTIYPLV